MPKRPNAKKLASQSWTKIKTLEATVSEGKYLVARIEKALGFCQFQASVETSKGLKTVTVLIRGKFKGGKNCPTRVENGCYVMVDGDLSRTMEVVGVVNRQAELNTLKKSGRMGVFDAADDEDDIFEHEVVTGPEGDIWAKKDDDREAEAVNILARYRRAEAGVRYRTSRVVVESGAAPIEAISELAGEDDTELVEVAVDAADADAPTTSFRPVTSKRRLAAMAAKAAVEMSAAEAAEKEELAGIWANMVPDWIEDAKYVAPSDLPSWDDELDIDAI